MTEGRGGRSAGGSLELLVLLDQLFHFVLKGFGGVLGHLISEMIKDAFSEAIQTLAFLIPIIFERSRMKVTDDAGDVNISALEDLARQGRPKVGLLTISEALKLH